MGTLRGDNGGGERPQEGGGLPDLPPEWGTVIIPDDPAELDDEGARLRRVFRREALRRRWRRRMHLRDKPLRRIDEDSPGLAVPLLIMTVAVIATLTSLFAVAWPGQRPRTTPQTNRSSAPISVAQIGMVDANGTRVPLRDVAPAVILLVEGCTCEALISSTVEAVNAARPTTVNASAPTGAVSPGPASHVSIIVVDTGVPVVPALSNPAVALRGLADPNHSLRTAVPALAVPTPGAGPTVAALLVAHDGTVIRVLPRVTTVADFQDDLRALW
jgi:hypothetical protein